MTTPSVHRLAARCLCLTLAAATTSRIFAAAPVGPTVDLPAFKVTESPFPSDEKPWRYFSIRGFEFLSQTSDAATAKLAARLIRFSEVSEQIYTGVHNIREPHMRLILCAQRTVFESFIPARVRTEFGVENVNRLFFEDHGEPRIVLYVGPLDQSVAYAVDVNRAYLAARMRGAFPHLPAWYVEGISRIYAAAQIRDMAKHDTISVGKLDDRSPGAPADGADVPPDPQHGLSNESEEVLQGDVLALPVRQDLATASGAMPADPDSEDLPFMKYFSDAVRPVPSLPAIFTDAPPLTYTTWSQSCGLFVHYCLFGDFNAAREGMLFNFIVNYSKDPSGDGSAEFQAAFKSSYAKVAEDVGYYSRSVTYRVKKYFLPIRLEPTIALRDATDGETADLKAGALASGGHPELAEAVLVAAYNRAKAAGPVDLRLIAALGLWDAAHGHADQSDALIALAVAKKYPEPGLYVAVTRRRLERVGEGRPLTAAEVSDCLAPLMAARALGATDAEVYTLMATVWLKSANAPVPADLKVLAEGIKEYPADADLAFETARAWLRAGADSPAQAIIQREIASGDAGIRTRFAALQTPPSK